MKVRDSGIPDEEIWSGFFDQARVLASFGLDQGIQDLVEFGCGDGTFMLTAAGIVAVPSMPWTLNRKWLMQSSKNTAKPRLTMSKQW